MEPGLLRFLGRALLEARREAGVLQVDIATQAKVSRAVVVRLERGQRWPEVGADRLVAAYAAECEVDWLELWERAAEAARA